MEKSDNPRRNSLYASALPHFLTLFAGAMSGLTVGYLSIDELILELKISTGTPEEKYYANRILPIVTEHHWLLVTLLLCNAFAMEAWPIVLDRLLGELMAIIISVSLVWFAGEIIPQALCTGPNQMKIASSLSSVTYGLMWITYPISYPLGLLIDYWVGKHWKSRFCNSDLKGWIEWHTIDAIEKIQQGEHLNDKQASSGDIGWNKDQANWMIGAWDIKQKTARELMIPLNKVFMLDYNSVLTQDIFNDQLKGFSRIPVYSNSKDNIIGILRVKQIIGWNLSQNRTLRQLNVKLSNPIFIKPTMLAIDLLTDFRQGRSHMALITDDVEKCQKNFGLDQNNSYLETNSWLQPSIMNENSSRSTMNIIGIATLEDVIEKMFNFDIWDEDDYSIIKHKQKKGVQEETIKKKLTNQLCQSFLDSKKGKINSIIDNSYKLNVLNETPDNCYSWLDNKDESNLWWNDKI